MATPPLPEIPDGPASPEVIEIERALNRITYLSTRARQHEPGKSSPKCNRHNPFHLMSTHT